MGRDLGRGLFLNNHAYQKASYHKGRIMNTAITIITDEPKQSASAIIQQDIDTTWLNYWKPAEAYKDFFADLANMPSSKTPERHTMRVYTGGLQYFFECYGNAMPTKSLINRYITHLRHEKEWRGNRGLSVSTIGSKYLAPLRKYIDFLASQHIQTRIDGSPLTNQDRNYIMDAREQMRAAINVKTPKDENTSNLAPLYQHGERLTVGQIQQLYDTCDVNSLAGLRDFAILYTGFTTGMRIAELRRMTLSKIKQSDACYLIHVRRKRGNRDPISLDHRVYEIICAYVTRYNNTLPSDDPRRIGADTPLWQAIQHNDTPFPHKYQDRSMHNTGISASAIRSVLKKRAEQANAGSLSEFPQFAPHDMRRSVASIAHQNGMGIPEIQALLGHKNGGVTLNYIGKPPQPEKSLITNLPGINWNIPNIPNKPHQQELSAS
jgi:site-specific recombinase XerD